MLRLLVLLVGLAIALLAGCGEDAVERPAATPQASPVVRALRAGGHVLVFRHAITETKTDTQEFLSSC